MSMTEQLNGIANDLATAMLANAKRLCQKQNTGQCAAICLSHMSTQTKPDSCPEIANVWLDEDCRAALERAKTWVLTPSDSKAFVETLFTPPEPNAALKDAALRHQRVYTERDEFLQNHIREKIKHIWREHDQFYAMTNDGQVYIREERDDGNGIECFWIEESQVILP